MATENFRDTRFYLSPEREVEDGMITAISPIIREVTIPGFTIGKDLLTRLEDDASKVENLFKENNWQETYRNVCNLAQTMRMTSDVIAEKVFNHVQHVQAESGKKLNDSQEVEIVRLLSLKILHYYPHSESQYDAEESIRRFRKR